MRIVLFIIIPATLIFLLSNCEKETSDSQVGDVKGYAQKGPFINGSQVTIYDLRKDLFPTGKSYNTQISNNNGAFELRDVLLSSRYASLRVDGYYFNEVSGDQSASTITLNALSDISDKSNINVNLLTHLEKSRVEYLMKKGQSFLASKTQANKEILAIFNIEKPGMKNSEDLDISETGDDNGILLAISAIIQGYRQESEFTELLSNIINDIKEDGTLNDELLGSTLINHTMYLDTTSIKNNLAGRYNDIGSSSEIPHFGKYISNFISQTDFKITAKLIDYPVTGSNGVNFLDLADTLYSGGYDYRGSLAASLVKGTSLEIKISAIASSDTSEVSYWAYSLGSNMNWSITTFNLNDTTQTFTAIESGKDCDLRIFFTKGRFLIEYFEMNAVMPTRSKYITVI
jgi:hypothetical protein